MYVCDHSINVHSAHDISFELNMNHWGVWQLVPGDALPPGSEVVALV